MDREKTINSMPFGDAANEKWYLSMKPASPKETLNVEFEDGKSYKFLGTGIVNVGDPVVIDYGGASSYKMGNVVGIEKGITIKRTHALKPLFTFTTNPGKTEIKKNLAGVVEMKEVDDVSPYFDSFYLDRNNDRFHVVDQLVSGILNAITVVAFPELAGDKAVNKAKVFLAEEKYVPGFLFGSEFTGTYFAAGSDSPMQAETAETSLTGFYPGWKEDLLKCSVWGSDGLGRMERVWDEREQAYYLYYLKGSKNLEKKFSSSDDFKKMTNELAFRSALSILIRGGFRNLLEAALSVQMPIADFYDKLVEFAEDIGSIECYEVLKQTDYKNKTFDAVQVAAKEDVVSSKDFVIDDGILKKYKGDQEVVTIPEGVKVIGDQSFSGLNIKKVIMPDTVTKIEGKPFYGGMSVEEIVFSKNLSSIASFAFAGVKSLRSVDLSETKLKTIRKKCFLDCENLETVKLPKKLKSIEEYAFSQIAAKEMIFPATVEKIATNAIFPMWGYKEMSITDLYFEGTGSIQFTIPGREFPLRIHCRKDSKLWQMFETQNNRNMNSTSAFGPNKNVSIELIDYK